MWYTLPWAFDEFFHEYIPKKWVAGVHVFHIPFHRTGTLHQTCLRTLDATCATLASSLFALPGVVSSNRIETLHLSFWNQPFTILLSALRHVTLLNSINCLNNCSKFPATIQSIRILLFPQYPNYRPPNWSEVLLSISNLPQLSSFRVFLYSLLKPIDDESCRMIARVAPMFHDFGFCFRYKCPPTDGDELVNAAFKDHQKFIHQLLNYMHPLFSDKQPYYSIEDGNCGLAVWS